MTRREGSDETSERPTPPAWVPPVEMFDDGIPLAPTPDIGWDRRRRQFQAERSRDLTEWRLSLEDAVSAHRRLRRVLLILFLIAVLFTAAWGVAVLLTASAGSAPYEPLTRPAFWVAAGTAALLLAGMMWSQRQIHLFQWDLRALRDAGA